MLIYERTSKDRKKERKKTTELPRFHLSQLSPIFGQLVPDLWSTRTYPKSTRTYPKSTRTRVNKMGRVEHDRCGVGKSRS